MTQRESWNFWQPSREDAVSEMRNHIRTIADNEASLITTINSASAFSMHFQTNSAFCLLILTEVVYHASILSEKWFLRSPARHPASNPLVCCQCCMLFQICNLLEICFVSKCIPAICRHAQDFFWYFSGLGDSMPNGRRHRCSNPFGQGIQNPICRNCTPCVLAKTHLEVLLLSTGTIQINKVNFQSKIE